MEQRVKELEDDYRLQKNDVFIPLVNGKSQVSNLQNIEEEEFKDYSPLKQLNPISSNSEKISGLNWSWICVNWRANGFAQKWSRQKIQNFLG